MSDESEQKTKEYATAKPIKDDREAETVAVRVSHTLATLEISLASYKEIKYLL